MQSGTALHTSVGVQLMTRLVVEINQMTEVSVTKLPAYVQQALVQLYARLTKIGWNEGTKSNYPFRSVTQDLGKFLQVKLRLVSYQLHIHVSGRTVG